MENQENIEFGPAMEQRHPVESKCIDVNLLLAMQGESCPLRKVSESLWTESERDRDNVEKKFCLNFQLIQKWSLKSPLRWVIVLVLHHSGVGQVSSRSKMGCTRPGWGWTGDHTEDMFACACSMLGKIFLRLSQESQEKGTWSRENSVSQNTQERKHRARPAKAQDKGWF